MRRVTGPVLSELSRRLGSNYTHFGFEEVPVEDKSRRVNEVFHRVAEKYDLMNDLMSLGAHRLWKDAAVRTLDPSPGLTYVDIAGGTGDMAFRIMDSIRLKCSAHKPVSLSISPSNVHVLDINKDMLSVGQKRAEALGIDGLSWMVADAECLPLPDSFADGYTVAFGVRNMTHIDKALREAWRVLKPGGQFVCLEFSRVEKPLLAQYDPCPALPYCWL